MAALEMVAAVDSSASLVARLNSALDGNDESALAAAMTALKELNPTTLLSALVSNPDLTTTINSCILHDSSPLLTKWLFELVGGHDSLAEFVLQFVPTIAWVFIRRLNSSEPSSAVGVLLQAICEHQYANGSLDERFQLETPVPDLSVGSIYHKPVEGQKLQQALTVNRLRDHDIRSRVGSAPSTDIDEHVETSIIGGFKLVRSVLAKFVVAMPKLSLAAISNFCILSIRLCSDDTGLYRPFTRHIWDPPHEKQTFFSQSFSMLDLELLLVRGLIQAFVMPECRPLTRSAITALHHKAQQDIEPAVLLSTSCLMERMRFDI